MQGAPERYKVTLLRNVTGGGMEQEKQHVVGQRRPHFCGMGAVAGQNIKNLVRNGTRPKHRSTRELRRTVKNDWKAARNRSKTKRSRATDRPPPMSVLG